MVVKSRAIWFLAFPARPLPREKILVPGASHGETELATLLTSR